MQSEHFFFKLLLGMGCGTKLVNSSEFPIKVYRSAWKSMTP